MRYRLRAVAQRDVRNLYRRSIETFGIKQADRYYDGLIETFDLLVEFPESGAARTDLSEGLRFRPYGTHNVYYRLGIEEIIVVRILHMRQDESKVH